MLDCFFSLGLLLDIVYGSLHYETAARVALISIHLADEENQ